MSLESGFLQFEELPTIDSSMDPISTNSTSPLPLTGTGFVTVLPERTRSLNIDEKLISEGVGAQSHTTDERRGRSASPIPGNAKRRRSVASAPGDDLGRQSLRTNHSATPASRDDSFPNNEASLGISSRGSNPTKQREPSRGRTIRRATSYPNETEPRKRRKLNGKNRTPSKQSAERTENIKNSFGTTKGPEKLIFPPLPLSGNADNKDGNGNIAYERRGSFRLKKSKIADEFRFPKSPGQPEPIWRAGDGFSSDEAKPDFMFLVTSTHKQRRPGPLPSIGKLQLEVEDSSKEDLRGLGISQPKVQRLSQYQMKHRRGAVKDVWPNRENFSEELEVRKRNPTVPENGKIIPSTIPPQPTPKPRAREMFMYSPATSRVRKHSDFEHFGQRLQKSGEQSTTDDTETRAARIFHIGQPEPGTGEECEYEEEYETGEEYELVPSTDYNEESDEGEYYTTSHEDTPSASRSREASTHNSTTSIPDGEKDELEVAEQRPSDSQTPSEHIIEISMSSRDYYQESDQESAN
ncbi:hypothetical protein F4776DRAFT_676691 [Hypoxylon sp. NC0597]|nr:hypothetical protein F4776DRAFT_676691 [Hypoxylon sp. NC0597]